ncbi:MAG: hypothetical protein NC310_00255 [Roseburia sp.]|nr:hypothetical protein [Anaeroplasma bactoclasticum]MCM1195484.1 hypothetical protein [Roseburia sp.]
MFFKSIAEYSKKKMLALTVICNLIYVCLLVVGPSIVIGCRYAIFGAVSTKYRLTGIGTILFVVVALYAYIYLKKLIRKLPEIKLNQQRVKFTLEMVLSVIPLVLLIIGGVLARDDTTRAFDTLLMCLGFFIGSILFDGLFLKYIDAENELRQKALLNKEVAKREKLV